jgi:hypothetical protein
MLVSLSEVFKRWTIGRLEELLLDLRSMAPCAIALAGIFPKLPNLLAC